MSGLSSRGGGRTERIRRLRLCAALAARDEEALVRCMADLVATAEPVGVEEALLQSYLFVGYPVALNAFALWRRVSGRGAPDGRADARSETVERWESRGADTCRRVYGDTYEELRDNVRALHPDLERWMVTEGYGKVLAREGLDLVERELCIVAMLAVLDTPRQLHSHLRGARAVGVPDAEVEEALTVAGPFASAEAAARARDVWARVRARAPRTED